MKAIEIITIPVSNQQKAKEFYSKLGFELIIEAPSHDGQTWIQKIDNTPWGKFAWTKDPDGNGLCLHQK